LLPIPERRPLEKQAKAYGTETPSTATKNSAKTVATAKKAVKVPSEENKFWYCKQCGYVVFRESPPYVCPICKAKKEFFEEIKL